MLPGVSRRDQFASGLRPKREVGDLVAVQMAQLSPANGKTQASEPAWPVSTPGQLSTSALMRSRPVMLRRLTLGHSWPP
jgi:hypothetical protein